MTLFNVGRICMKIAGRDAGRKCVVVEEMDVGFVLIDGATRRKKVNIKHLEPLAETIDIQNKASHQDVITAFDKIGIKLVDSKSRKATEKPKKQKKKAAKKEGKKDKKSSKKESKKEEKEAPLPSKKVDKSVEDLVGKSVEESPEKKKE